MLEKEEGGRQRAYAVVWKILTNEEGVLSSLVRCYRQNTMLTQCCFFHAAVNVLQRIYWK